MKKIIGLTLGIIMAVSVLGAVMSISAEEAETKDTKDIVKDLAENEIGMARAAEIALKDAGITADQVEFSKKINEFSNGNYVYEIHFLVRNNMKYEYEIDGFTETIREKNQEPWEPDDDMEYQGLAQAGQNFFITADEDTARAIEEAFIAAVADAGLKEDEAVTFKYGVDYENSKVVMAAGFFVPGKMKYDYDIELITNAVVDKNQDPWDAEDEMEYKDMMSGAALQLPAGESPAAVQGNIGDEEAKQIALKDAGYTEAEVRMKELRKDFDDGTEVYDVSFFGPDGMEYEYDIRVADGVIIDKNVEFDD